MPKQVINTGSALGPYSPAVIAGNHLYVAGHCGFLPGTSDIAEGGLEAEFRQTLENLKWTVERSGFGLDDVVSTTCYLRDMDHWPILNEIYGSHFTHDVPARAAVAVVGLPLGANLEISCIAWRDI